MRAHKAAAVALGLLLTVTSSGPASAEWFADLYLGGAFTQTHDVDLNIAGVDVTLQDVEFDRSLEFGGRGGYWFGALPFLGLGLDVFHFNPDLSSQTVDTVRLGVTAPQQLFDLDLSVVGLSFDVMLRWPLLKSPEFPHGRLQPYVTVGPTLFIVEGEDTSNFAPPANQSDTDTTVGVKVGGGVTFLITKNVGVFTEYRYTHFKAELDFDRIGFGSVKAEPVFDTHHVVVGASFRF
jgi:opacity protein-like surface antigen